MEFSLFCEQCHTYLGTELEKCPRCGTSRSTLFKLPEPGTPLWTARIPSSGRAKPAIAGDMVIFPWGDRRDVGGVTAFDRNTGSILWEFHTETTVEAAPVISGKKVYLATLSYVSGERVYCLDFNSGKEVWSESLVGSAWSSPVVQDGRVFVGCDSGLILGFSSETGEKLRNSPIPFIKGRMWLVPVNDTLFAALSENGSMQLFSAVQSAGTWRENMQLPGRITGAPTLYNNRLYFGLSTGDAARPPLPAEGCLMELNIKQQFARVAAGNLTQISAAPCIADDVVYLSSRDHRIHACDLKTGKERWIGEAQRSFMVEPEVLNGLVIAGSHDGTLYAFAARPDWRDGQAVKPVWEYPLPGSPKITSGVTCHDGIGYVSAEDGSVMAFPYHLGEYEWMAVQLERVIDELIEKSQTSASIKSLHKKVGETYAFASCFADPEHQVSLCERAGSHWISAAEPEWQARLYEGRCELGKAAVSFEKCAEFRRGSNRLLSAEDYYEAARMYWRLNRKSDHQRCLKEACLLGTWPLIDLEYRNEGYLQQLEKGKITIRACNKGFGDAQILKFKLGGSLMEYLEFTVRDPLPHDSWLDLTLEITPIHASSDLVIEVEYQVPSTRWPITYEMAHKITADPPQAKLKIGDMVKGNVRVYNPQGRPVNLDIGDNIYSTVEIIMADKPAAENEIS